MDKEEWQKLQKENPKEYKNKYLKFMYSEDNAYNCDECPEQGSSYRGPGNPLPCGQQNCWVVCHCRQK